MCFGGGWESGLNKQHCLSRRLDVGPLLLHVYRAAIATSSADNEKLKEEVMLENKFSLNPTTQVGKTI